MTRSYVFLFLIQTISSPWFHWKKPLIEAAFWIPKMAPTSLTRSTRNQNSSSSSTFHQLTKSCNYKNDHLSSNLPRRTSSSSSSSSLLLVSQQRYCSMMKRTMPLYMAKPKSGSIVDSYQSVSVNCMKCKTRLFRYKKKNGTKSNLIKCYVERIAEDSAGLLSSRQKDDDREWRCPNCNVKFGRDSMIHGKPAIKMIGGKIRMTKK